MTSGSLSTTVRGRLRRSRTVASSSAADAAGGRAARAPRGPVDPRLVRRARATRPYLVGGVGVGSATAV
ncbi:MAG: hypothetical protein LBH76_09115, partial [Propionibacteriaceae bacterium]|nr:hypothetical protein [Propionibacteriaceae bacterium]